MRNAVPDWLRKWASAVLIGMTLGAGGVFAGAIKWYGDGREEKTLNSAARVRIESAEERNRKQDEILSSLNGSVIRLGQSIDSLNATIQNFNTGNIRENDLQWQAIHQLAPRR